MLITEYDKIIHNDHDHGIKWQKPHDSDNENAITSIQHGMTPLALCNDQDRVTELGTGQHCNSPRIYQDINIKIRCREQL